MAKLEKEKQNHSEGKDSYVCCYCGYQSDYPLTNHDCWQFYGATNWEKSAKDKLRFGDSGDPNFEYT